jgi:Mechanosensitive ion channel, conserved TM helix/Mechanosensitive ion channel, beta-domain
MSLALPLASVLDQAGNQLGGFIPRLGGALLLLVVGIIVARVLARILRRALRMAGLDSTSERWGVADVLGRAGLGRSLAHVLAVALRISLTVVVVFAAVSLLGLQFLSQSLNEGVLFLPKVLAALALVLIGVVLAAFVRERADRTATQWDLPVPIGPVLQMIVLAIFVITAAAQITISIGLLTVLVAILLAAAAAPFAIAFGLGGRDVARARSAGRYVRAAFEEGQTIRVDGMRGSIESIEPSATVLRTEDARIRVPNHVLISETVVIEEPEAGAEEPSEP